MRPTRLGSPRRGIVLSGLGHDPQEPIGDPVESTDYLLAEAARAWYPVSGSGVTALVQDAQTTPGAGAAVNQNISFGSPVTGGNLLVALIATRSFSGDITGPPGWTPFQIDTNGFNSGDGALFWAIADGTEGTGPFTFNTGAGTDRSLSIAEFSGPNGLADSASTTGGASASYNIGDVTPTASTATTLIAGALNSDNISGVTSFTTVSNLHAAGGINGPVAILAYRAIDPASGNYSATVTQTSSDIRGGVHLAFSDFADPAWIPAPLTIDDDDATYHEITGHEECWRGQLFDNYQIGSARLVIGTELAGSRSYDLEGQTLADIDADTGTLLGTFTFTATGSYTADTIEIGIAPASGFEFYRLIGPDENRRIFTVNLFSPTNLTSDEVEALIDAHIDDPVDAHDASAVSIADAGGWFTATTAEAAMQELAAKAIGYQAHGNTGTTETFDAAIGWHSATLNDDCTLTLTANPTGTVSSLFLELLQDGTGGRDITLPSSVVNKTELEADQDTTLDSTALLVLLSRDGGTTWYGGWWGQGGGSSVSPATTVEDETTFGITPAVGTDLEYARQDHTHGSPDDSAFETAGHYELLMDGGSPPEPLENGSGTDWLYVWVPG